MGTRDISTEDLSAMSPQEFRSIVRHGEWTSPTVLACRGYVQANLAIVPKDWAFEFLLFCLRNPKPCPVIEVTEPGCPYPLTVAPTADLRKDVPKYRIFVNGKLEAEPTDITEYWRDDLVAFLLGCSHSFDWALRAANVRFRLIGAYTSNIPCTPAGRISGPMVVSCRLVKGTKDAVRAIQISSRLPAVHGSPLHIGDPTTIGIKDLYHPDVFAFPEPTAPQESDEIMLFWGCGVTPQKVALETKIPFMITHSPGHMFIVDQLVEEVSVF
jgi:uncharacterized protein YcsI (UPF0317 family)